MATMPLIEALGFASGGMARSKWSRGWRGHSSRYSPDCL